MRFLLLRLLLLMGLLGMTINASAFTVNITGDFASEQPYYIYHSGPIELTGEIDDMPPVPDYQESWRWGSWFIFSKTQKTDGTNNRIDPAECGRHYNIWGYETSPDVATGSHISTTSKDNPITIWVNEPGDEGSVNEIPPCSAALTWLALKNDNSWFDSPSFTLTIGPENALIQGDEAFDSSSNVPADLHWIKGNEYVLRLFARADSASEAVAERSLTYMGDAFARDLTKDAQGQAADHPGDFIIEIAPNSPLINNHYFFNIDCTTWLTNVSNGSNVMYENLALNQTSNVYRAIVNIRNIKAPNNTFKSGDEVAARTICNSTVNPFSNVAQLITQNGDNAEVKREIFTHNFKIGANAVLSALKGHYLPDGSIHVEGQFDGVSGSQASFQYSVKNRASQSANWITPQTVRWNIADCQNCFSFNIPASQLSGEQLNLIQLLPDLHSAEQADNPDSVVFSPQDFIDIKFINAQGEARRCGEGEGVTSARNNDGIALVKLQLTLKHAVDKLSGDITLPPLPVTYRGQGTVAYAAQGQPEAATHDIVLDENDQGKQTVHWVVNSPDKVLKAGTYILTLPVEYPAYQRDEFGAESLLLHASVYSAHSLLLQQREADSRSAPVQCLEVFDGSTP